MCRCSALQYQSFESNLRKLLTPQDTEMDVLGIRLICVLSLLSLAAGFGSSFFSVQDSDGFRLSTQDASKGGRGGGGRGASASGSLELVYTHSAFKFCYDATQAPL